MRILVTAGTGTGPTPLAAFDAALLSCGVANNNLIHLSSIIPPDSTVERATFVAPDDEYGHRLYVVMARREELELGNQAWAGLGWTQEPRNGRGLFVEAVGGSETAVRESIHATLASMMASRGRGYGPMECEVIGIECHGEPVSALAIAAYTSEGWI